jgi:hypothetical protein
MREENISFNNKYILKMTQTIFVLSFYRHLLILCGYFKIVSFLNYIYVFPYKGFALINNANQQMCIHGCMAP